jgi:nucleoid-associated protein YgaU
VRYKNIFGMTISSKHFQGGHRFSINRDDFAIDFSQVQAPVIEKTPTPDELAEQVEAMERGLALLEQQVTELMNRQAPIETTHVLARHTVKRGETLSHLALRYYGFGKRFYWKLIYDANKAVIGDDPSLILPGQVLTIPSLETVLPRGA